VVFAPRSPNQNRQVPVAPAVCTQHLANRSYEADPDKFAMNACCPRPAWSYTFTG